MEKQENEIERRTRERKAELERLKWETEAERTANLLRAVDDLPFIAGLVCEFLCVLAGLGMTLTGHPESGAVALLTAMYLRMGRRQ